MTPTEANLLRQIRARPDDDAPRLVYADWLAERGDPRGELIHVQCELAAMAPGNPRRVRLKHRERQLLAEHRGRWLEELPPEVAPYELERGFLAHPLALRDESRVERARLLRLSPTLYEVVGVVKTGYVTEVLEALVCGPDGPDGRAALKHVCVCPEKQLGDPDEMAAYRRTLLGELAVTRAASHVNVVEARGLAYLDGELAMVTEWIDGVDLRRVQRRFAEDEHRAPPRFGAAVGLCLCRALHVLHAIPEEPGRSKTLVHREVRPDHVMVTREGVVKLIDFGWAVAAENQLYGYGAHQISPGPSLDPYRFRFMSYEQARGESLDGRTDLFSTGILMYELCAGRPLFQGDSAFATLRALIDGVIPPITGAAPDVPSSLAEVIHRALRREREERYQSAFEMGMALERTFQIEGWPRPEEVVAAAVGAQV
jgi:serine/threonine-protein kinase